MSDTSVVNRVAELLRQDLTRPLRRSRADIFHSRRGSGDTSKKISIPSSVLAAAGLIDPSGARNKTVDEFRTVKRPLLLNIATSSDSDAQACRRILVASAFPNEGKTYCTLNLALSLSEERDHSVLLIDGDVAKPSIASTLGLEPRPGLLDAIRDESIDPNDLVQETSIPNLCILHAGTLDDNATELLASAGMKRTISRLTDATDNEVIVFDSPPLLLTTEAVVLAQYAGQVLLVVEAGSTPQKAVKHSLEALEGTGAIANLLINKIPNNWSRRGYGARGYGYGYGYKKNRPPSRS